MIHAACNVYPVNQVCYTVDPVELQQRAPSVSEGIQACWLQMSDGVAYKLDRVADAHRDIEGLGTQSKLNLTP